jgi:hydroxycarboxylate dehydrogenase B
MSKTIIYSDLIESIAIILIASGSSEKEANTVASNLVMANLSGHDSHGVGMLPRYVSAVLEGGLKPNTSVKTVLDLGHMLTLDGQRGYGQVIGEQAMNMGIERAKQHGSCIMTLSNSHHLGRIGHWAEMATAAGLVSMHFVNVMARPAVAP